MNSSSVSAKQEFVMSSTDCGEDNSQVRDCADELAFLVKDEHFSILAQDDQEPWKLTDHTALHVLLDVNFLQKFSLALRKLPELDTPLFQCKEPSRRTQNNLLSRLLV